MGNYQVGPTLRCRWRNDEAGVWLSYLATSNSPTAEIMVGRTDFAVTLAWMPGTGPCLFLSKGSEVVGILRLGISVPRL